MSRPPVLILCSTCGEGRITTIFPPKPKNGSERKLVCFVCEPPKGSVEAREAALKRDTEAKARTARYAAKKQPPVPRRVKPTTCSWPDCPEPIFHTGKGLCSSHYAEYRLNTRPRTRQELLSEKIAASVVYDPAMYVGLPLLSPVPKCSCCHAYDDLAQDGQGAHWCPECAYYSFSCGRCVHNPGKVIFEHLQDLPWPEPFIKPVLVYTNAPVLVDDVVEP